MSARPPARRGPGRLIDIRSRDYWFKALDNHQVNWCLIEEDRALGHSVAYFFHELSGVFDRLTFVDRREAEHALRCNGFQRLAERADLDQNAVHEPPFQEDEHWNGQIYSSGRFWRAPPTVPPT
jgi:hypothetical protein